MTPEQPRPSTTSAGTPGSFVAWLIGERLVRGAISAVALAVVARHLAPAGFGVLNLALTIIGTAMPLAQFGFDAIVVRELVKAPGRAGELLGTATAVRFATGAACAAAVFVLGLTVPALSAAREALNPLCFMLLVQAVETPDLWFRAEVNSKLTVVARTSAIFAGAIGKCVLAFTGAGVIAFAWLTLGEVLLFEALLWLLYRRQHRLHVWRWDPAFARTLLPEAALFALAATIGGLAFRVDQLCVGVLLGEAAAGKYFAALRLIEIPTFVAASTATALFPLLAQGDDTSRPGRLQSTFSVLAAIGWVTALGTTVCGPWLLRLVVGADYDAAGPALVVRGWAMLPFFSGMIRAHLATLARSGATQLAIVLFGLLVQLGLNALLVPLLGLTGAALAFLGAEMCSAWILPWFLPALRAGMRAQWHGWWQPWRPSAWPSLLRVFRPAR